MNPVEELALSALLTLRALEHSRGQVEPATGPGPPNFQRADSLQRHEVCADHAPSTHARTQRTPSSHCSHTHTAHAALALSPYMGGVCTLRLIWDSVRRASLVGAWVSRLLSFSSQITLRSAISPNPNRNPNPNPNPNPDPNPDPNPNPNPNLLSDHAAL
jgi:hypothetical protein